MSQLFHYLAWGISKDGAETVKSLYLGFDGASGQAAYEAAIQKPDHGFTRIKRIVNFDGGLLPIVAASMKGTTPVFNNPKPANVAAKVADAPKSIMERESAEKDARTKTLADQEKLRQSRLAPPLESNPEPTAESQGGDLKTDGPTFEEFVAAGYKPEHYPPAGYAPKDSQGLDDYLQAKSDAGVTEQAAASSGLEPVKTSQMTSSDAQKASPEAASKSKKSNR